MDTVQHNNSYDWRKRHAFLFKTVAIALIFAFILYDITWAQAGTPISWQHAKADSSLKAPNITLNGISIPNEQADLKGSYSGTGELIINIQDAHTSLSAQYSIVKLLDTLLTKYDMNLVAVEGSEGYLDTSIFKTFPDKEITRKAADYLMQKGMMSAGEFFTIISDKDIALYGIEDEELYKKNVEGFKTIIDESAACIDNVKALKKVILKLEERIYKKDVLEFARKACLYDAGDVNFSTYWKYLYEITKKNNIDLDTYQHVSHLVSSIESEETIDFDKATRERKTLVDELSKRIGTEALEELVLKSIAFKKREISGASFHAYIINLAQHNSINPVGYEDLIKYTQYISSYENIDVAGLFSEIASIEELIADKLITAKDEKALYDFGKKVDILKGLFTIKLSNNELDYLIKHRFEFDAEIFSQFIKEQSGKWGMEIGKGFDLTFIMDKIDDAIVFYSKVQERNNAMIRNTVHRMKTEKQNVAALITGGFHSEGLKELMEDSGLSYFVIAPKFEGEEERPYITVLTAKKEPYEDLIKSGQYELAVHQFCSKGDIESLALAVALHLIGFEGRALGSKKRAWKANYKLLFDSLPEHRNEALSAQRRTPDEFNALLDLFTEGALRELRNMGRDNINGAKILEIIKFKKRLNIIAHDTGIKSDIRKIFKLLLASDSRDDITYFRACEELAKIGSDLARNDNSLLLSFLINKIIKVKLPSVQMESRYNRYINACLKIIEANPGTTHKLINYLIVTAELQEQHIQEFNISNDTIILLEHIINKIDRGSYYKLVRKLVFSLLKGFSGKFQSNPYDNIRKWTRKGGAHYTAGNLHAYLRGAIHWHLGEYCVDLVEKTLEFYMTSDKKVLEDYKPLYIPSEYPDAWSIVVEGLDESPQTSEAARSAYKEIFDLIVKQLYANSLIEKGEEFSVNMLPDIKDEYLNHETGQIYKDVEEKIREGTPHDTVSRQIEVLWNLKDYISSYRYLAIRYGYGTSPEAFDINNPKIQAALEKKDFLEALRYIAEERKQLKEKILKKRTYDRGYEEDQINLQRGLDDQEGQDTYSTVFSDLLFNLYSYDMKLSRIEEFILEKLINEIPGNPARVDFARMIDMVILLISILNSTLLSSRTLDDFAGILNSENLTPAKMRDICQLIANHCDLMVKNITQRYSVFLDPICGRNSSETKKAEFMDKICRSFTILDRLRYLSDKIAKLSNQSRNRPSLAAKALFLGINSSDPPSSSIGELTRRELSAKGIGLLRLVSLRIPVPPGFIVPSYIDAAEAIMPVVNDGLGKLRDYLRLFGDQEGIYGKEYAACEDPLLLSVRAGWLETMPGQLDTITNLGIFYKGENTPDKPHNNNIDSLIDMFGNDDDARWTAWDCYRRFLQDYGEIVLNIDRSRFSSLVDKMKKDTGVVLKKDFSWQRIRDLALQYKAAIIDDKGKSAESELDDPRLHLEKAVNTVKKSWHNAMAIDYAKNVLRISSEWDSIPVIIQTMVYGNFHKASASSIIVSKYPQKQRKGDIDGEIKFVAQGRDIADGVVNPARIFSIKANLKDCYDKLCNLVELADEHFGIPQQLEVIIQRGRVFVAQTKDAYTLPNKLLQKFKNPYPTEDKICLRAKFSLPGNCCVYRGLPYFASSFFVKDILNVKGIEDANEDAVSRGYDGIILLLRDAEPKDIAVIDRTLHEKKDTQGKAAYVGCILVEKGGQYSHAADVARLTGVTAAIGIDDIKIDAENKKATFSYLDRTINLEESRTPIIVDGLRGFVWVQNRALKGEQEVSHAFRPVSWWSLLGLGGGLDWVVLFSGAFIGFSYYMVANQAQFTQLSLFAAPVFAIITLMYAITSFIRTTTSVIASTMAMREKNPRISISKAVPKALIHDIGHDEHALKILRKISPAAWRDILIHEQWKWHIPGLIAFTPEIITKKAIKQLEKASGLRKGRPLRPVQRPLPQILVGVPAQMESSKLDKVKEVEKKYAGIVELVYLTEKNQKEQLDNLTVMANRMGIGSIIKPHLDSIDTEDVNVNLSLLIEKEHLRCFREASKAVLEAILRRRRDNNEEIAEMEPQKYETRLKKDLKNIMNHLFSLNKVDMDIFLAKASLWQARSIAYDFSVIGTLEALGSTNHWLGADIVMVMTDAMIQSDPGLLAKVVARQSLENTDNIKDVLAIYNPNVTEENLHQYLEGLGADGAFTDNTIVLYDDLKPGEREGAPIAVERAVKEKIGKGYEIRLVGGPQHFVEVAGLISSILQGVSDEYMAKLESFLERHRHAYEEMLIDICEKNGKLDSKAAQELRRKRTMRQESEEYREFIREYHDHIKEILSRL